MVYMLLGTGFEETEAIAPLDLLRRAGVEVKTVGLNGSVITGSHGIRVVADMEISDLDVSDGEMIILPGGLGGVASIRACQKAIDAIRQVWDAGKFVAAICAAPTILADLGITKYRKAVCYPGCEDQMGETYILDVAAIEYDRVITGASAGCAIPFGLKLIEVLKGQEAADAIASQIVIR